MTVQGLFGTGMDVPNADLRVEHYATDQPTPTGDTDDLDGGWYFYKA